jgi:hypothetical protein
MSFDPTLPANGAPILSAELRNQFNALKALLDALQTQLQPLMPVLGRTPGVEWTLDFPNTGPVYWQIWGRNDAAPVWAVIGEKAFTDFPVPDADIAPGGVWWQVKVCGEDMNSRYSTAFSNIISFGPVPE